MIKAYRKPHPLPENEITVKFASNTFGVQVEQWDPAFADFVSELAKKKSLVITGDFNCAHQNMDVHSPWTNKKTPGFTEVCQALHKQADRL